MTAPTRPYKFLDAYTSDDKDIFFGRDRETRVLVTDITVNRLVVLFARTGTGKTSLINAGARPRLESNGFETFFIRVNQDPVASARDELVKHRSVKKLARGSLADQLEQLVQKLQRPIVLFFDQFEEFFIYVQRRDSQRGRDFIADVARLYRNPESGVHFVFSMREEFFVEMDAFRDEIPSIFHNESNLRLRRFDRKEAYEAIVHPARVFDVRLDGDLVEQMLDDLVAAADAGGAIEPVQLQIVCDALWDHQTGGRLTLPDYQSLGDARSKESIAQQILYKRLEDAFARIESWRQLELLGTMLGELRTKQGTKWVRDVEGLKQVLTTGSTEVVPDDVDQLLRILEDVRFIRRSRRDSLVVIELSHDYLVERIDELQRRVRLIWPRRILRNVTASDMLPSRADLAAIAEHAKDLEISAEQALLLFAAALGQTAQPELWFAIAVAAGADPVKQLIEMIDDDRMPLLYSQLAIRLIERLLQNVERPEEGERLFGVLDLAVQEEKTTLEAQEALVRLATTGGIPIMASTSKRVQQLTYDRVDGGRLTPSAITWVARNIHSDESLHLLERALPRTDLAADAQAALLGLAHEYPPARDVLFSYLRQQLDGSAAQVVPATIRALALLDDSRVIAPLQTALRRHPTLAIDAKVALERAASSTNPGIASAARRALSAGIDEGSVPSAAALPVDEERVARNFGASGSHEIDLLADLIQRGQCIIVAGAGIHAPSPPGRGGIASYDERRLLTSELTLRIAKRCHYESRESTSAIPDFRRVMQFAEATLGRMALVSEINRAIRAAEGPSPLLSMLARLPIRAWITTNYDEMIENALLGTGKKPLRMWRPERFSQTGFVDQPLVVKIHGDVNNPEDLVLTEVDFVDYILNIGDSRDWLSRIVGDSCLLLLGWSYRNLENRFFLRLLRVHDSTIAFAVDPAPDVLMRQSEELRALHIIEDDLWSFVPRLVEAYARLT